MVFGLGTKDKAKKEAKVSKNATTNKKSASSSQGDEAAEILKKMEAKKDSGECAFC